MSDSITRDFEHLGIPLVNMNWSWGASNAQAVVLRAWQDQARLNSSGKLNVLVWQDWWSKGPSGRASLGGKERLRHLAEIVAGKPCYVVIISDRWEGKEDPKRSIVPSPARPIFRAGAVQRDVNGVVWIELAHRFTDLDEANHEIASLKAYEGKAVQTTDQAKHGAASLKACEGNTIRTTTEPSLEEQHETFYRVYDHFLRMEDFDWSIKYNPFETLLHNTQMICEWPVVGITKGALIRLQANNWETRREVVRGHVMSRRERGRRLFGDEDRLPYDEAFDFYCKNDETVLVLAKGENGNDGTNHWSEVIPLPRSLFGWRTGIAVYLRRDRKQYLQKLAAEHGQGPQRID